MASEDFQTMITTTKAAACSPPSRTCAPCTKGTTYTCGNIRSNCSRRWTRLTRSCISQALEVVAFTLPAYVQPDGCNIVIQPTRALQHNTYASLSAMSINVSIWNPQSENQASAVLLVTPEAMARREWKGFAQRQRLHRRVDRIILDEAQEVLLADQSWRKRLLDIRNDMDLVSCRQVYLSLLVTTPHGDAGVRNDLVLGD
ncbi:hypothetical protein EV127DRAFT_470295 [Xylaria flabelliformis]|nr:hypothetical protein EV127DRAFT_470295 [Xylaria flabelliformis]